MASPPSSSSSSGGKFSLAHSSLMRMLSPTSASSHLSSTDPVASSPSAPTTATSTTGAAPPDSPSPVAGAPRWGRRRPVAQPDQQQQQQADRAESPTKGRKRGNSLAGGLRGLFNKGDANSSGGGAGGGGGLGPGGTGANKLKKPRSRSRSTTGGGNQPRDEGPAAGLLDEADEEDAARWDEDERERVRDELDALAAKVIFQAGLDSVSRLLLVLCPCRLPPPSTLPRPRAYGDPTSAAAAQQGDREALAAFYARLASRFSTLTCCNPFTLVVLASPLPLGPDSSMPSPAQLLTAYLGLPPDVRKNALRVLIVHPGFWTRLAMRVLIVGEGAGAVSSKGRAKVRALKDLSALAEEVPIQQIDIPPQVYAHDLTLSFSIDLSGASAPHPKTAAPAAPSCKVFGVPLESLMGPEGTLGLPSVVASTITTIRTTGLDSDGIFRRSPLSSTLKTLVAAYDRGQALDLADYGPDAPFLAASLLRTFLARLPRGMFGPRCVAATQKCRCAVPPAPPDEAPYSETDHADTEAGGSGGQLNGWSSDSDAVRWARQRFVPAFLADLADPPPLPLSAGAFEATPPPPTGTGRPGLSPSPSSTSTQLPQQQQAASSPSLSATALFPPTAVAAGAPIVPYHLLLSALLGLLHDVARRHRRNRMDARNLAICIAPVLVRTGDVKLDAAMCRIADAEWTITAVLQLLIEGYYEIFDDGDLLDLEAPVPLRPDPFDSASTKPPSSRRRRPRRSRSLTARSVTKDATPVALAMTASSPQGQPQNARPPSPTNVRRHSTPLPTTRPLSSLSPSPSSSQRLRKPSRASSLSNSGGGGGGGGGVAGGRVGSIATTGSVRTVSSASALRLSRVASGGGVETEPEAEEERAQRKSDPSGVEATGVHAEGVFSTAAADEDDDRPPSPSPPQPHVEAEEAAESGVRPEDVPLPEDRSGEESTPAKEQGLNVITGAQVGAQS